MTLLLNGLLNEQNKLMKMQKILENQQINIQRKVLLKALLCLKPEPRIRLRISKIVKV